MDVSLTDQLHAAVEDLTRAAARVTELAEELAGDEDPSDVSFAAQQTLFHGSVAITRECVPMSAAVAHLRDGGVETVSAALGDDSRALLAMAAASEFGKLDSGHGVRTLGWGIGRYVSAYMGLVEAGAATEANDGAIRITKFGAKAAEHLGLADA